MRGRLGGEGVDNVLAEVRGHASGPITYSYQKRCSDDIIGIYRCIYHFACAGSSSHPSLDTLLIPTMGWDPSCMVCDVFGCRLWAAACLRTKTFLY